MLSSHASKKLDEVRLFLARVGLNDPSIVIEADVTDEAHLTFWCKISDVFWVFRFEGTSDLVAFSGDNHFDDPIAAFELDWLASDDPDREIRQAANVGIGPVGLAEQVDVVRRNRVHLARLLANGGMAEARRRVEAYRGRYFEEYARARRPKA